MLVKTGIIPFLRYIFNALVISIGLSNTPIQLPLIKTLVLFAKYSGLHSKTNLRGVLILNHFINGTDDVPLVIYVVIAKCL